MWIEEDSRRFALRVSLAFSHNGKRTMESHQEPGSNSPPSADLSRSSISNYRQGWYGPASPSGHRRRYLRHDERQRRHRREYYEWRDDAGPAAQEIKDVQAKPGIYRDGEA